MADSQLLAPWEYEGEIPQIVGAGEFVWQEHPGRFELLQKQLGVHRLVFRSRGDDGSWTVLLLLGSLAQGEAKNCVLKALHQKHYVREFRVASQKMIIRLNGIGSWCADARYLETSDFCLGKRTTQLTSGQLYDWILRLDVRANSDVSFAHRFMRMSGTQKWAYIFGFATETEYLLALSQIETLWRCVLYTDNRLWEEGSQLYWLIQQNDENEYARFWIPRRRDNHTSTARLKKWAYTLQQMGILPLHLQLDHICLRSFFNSNSALAQGRLSAPSAHEYLEAKLKLRDWGEQNLPAAVWAELKQFEA